MSTPLIGAGGRTPNTRADIENLFETSFSRRVSASPILQARLGIRTDQDKWDDISESSQIAAAAANSQDLRIARSLLASSTDPALELSLRLFIYSGETMEADFRWRRHIYLVSQMTGLHDQVVGTLLNNHPIRDYPDAAAYIDRLVEMPRLFGQLTDALEAQRVAGIAPPAFICTAVASSVDRLLTGAPLDGGPDVNIMLADFLAKVNKSDIAAQHRPELRFRAEAALRDHFAPAYRHLRDYLTRLAAARGDTRVGAWALPDGDAFYRSRLRRATTLPLSPTDLHHIGKKEVARVLGRMAEIAASRGFSGDLSGFWRQVETDGGQWFASTEEGRASYLAEAEALLARAMKAGPRIFSQQPRSPVEIRRVEAWREATVPKAFYSSPPHDRSRPGIYYVNLHDMRALPRYELAALLFHEAVPGHHIETTLAEDLADLPMFRKLLSIGAYSEGWGLYAEHLAEEQNLYPDDMSVFGLLSMRLLRAARVVADTGIHAFRWTREEAVAYLDDLLPLTPRNNRQEVDRYIAIPGQATAYLSGYRELLRLRERTVASQGAGFDIRRFHDVVLGQGPLPLPVLDELLTARFKR
ncbi:DUF885 domain-containing protein [Sphingopyxis sp. R3-92]|uniref:DUF885 domain-containing protein n=1 Tax=Sphingopyxis sp. R3-92 TaxID=3158553 RepID=UPI003EE6066E